MVQQIIFDYLFQAPVTCEIVVPQQYRYSYNEDTSFLNELFVLLPRHLQVSLINDNTSS